MLIYFLEYFLCVMLSTKIMGNLRLQDATIKKANYGQLLARMAFGFQSCECGKSK